MNTSTYFPYLSIEIAASNRGLLSTIRIQIMDEVLWFWVCVGMIFGRSAVPPPCSMNQAASGGP